MDREGEINVVEHESLTPHISLNALEGTRGCHTLRVTGKADKHSVYILIDSGSTHNFLNSATANKLQCLATPIQTLVVETANGGTMDCSAMCRNFRWRMQGVTFEADVFIVDLINCDMVLGIQWLATLGNIISNYKDLWMSFKWQGQDIVLKGTDCTKIQNIELTELNSLMVNPIQLASMTLCSLINLEEEDEGVHSMSPSTINNQQEQTALGDLLEYYKELFRAPEGLPPIRHHDHSIPMKEGAQAINLRPYRYSGVQKDILEQMVEEMLESGIIQQSNSPFASPVVLVKKKDGSWRFCVDYRALNQLTIKDKFPIPIVDELLEELVGATVFSKVDLRSGYHQIRMVSGDIFKTAFRTHNGHYEFLVMPFGLTNAPATFQSLMNDVFRKHLRKFVLVFFDDILIYSQSMTDHLQHLQIVFELLKGHQLVAKRSKCAFGIPQVEYLGHVISKEGVATDLKKIQAVRDWPAPQNVKQLRGFLGLTGYYRRFVRNYGSISKPLTQLLKKDAFTWRKETITAFRNLKRAMTQPPVLALPNLNKPFVVETDASGSGLGAVLMQDGHPIAFISKALGPRQQALSTYEREMLAILQAVTKWRHYLWGRHFTIRTDHVSLKYLLAQKVSYPSQHIWLTKLLGFDYDIEYRKGKENIAADALSRCTSGEVFSLTLSTISTKLLAAVQASWTTDNNLVELITQLQQDPNSHPLYAWANGHLYRKGKLVVGNDPTLQGQLISLYHDSAIGGHSGITVTAKRVGSLFYWRKQHKHVRAYVRECHICQKNKSENVLTPGLLQPLPIPLAPFVDISMDFIEGLPLSKGKNVVLVVVDRFSKYAHFIALSHPYTATTVADAFMNNIYKLHGLPASIVSDRDPVFLSRFWKDLFTYQGVQLLHSTAYHPQTDGQTEVVNRCLEQYLRCMTNKTPDQWSKWLPLAEWWYNTNYHSSLKTTPFEVLYGQIPPIHIPYFPKDSNVDAVDKQLTLREDMLKTIKSNLKLAQHRMVQLANKKRSERIFTVGDWVYLKLQPYRQQTVSRRASHKLAAKYYGPYQIMERIGVVAYRLSLPSSSAVHPVFHVSQLKQHVGHKIVHDD